MSTPINYLISAQHETGGWGYATGQKPVVEPTALVLLAIREEAIAQSAFQKGISWLLGCQHMDGGWGFNADDHESGWQTAWALIALRKLTQNNDSISKAEQWLVTVGTSEITQEEFKQPVFPKNDNIGAFIWPWLPGQVGWIEPTALALMALNGITGSQLANTRISAAISYFRKYRTPDGGWDIGNAGPLDTIVLPRAYPTALVLMALALTSPQEIQTVDLYALRQDLMRDPSILAQSSGLLALRVLRENDEALYANVTEHQLPDASWDHNPFFTAWSILGLRGYL